MCGTCPVGKEAQSDVAHPTRCKIYTGYLKYTLDFGQLVTAFRLFLEGENEFVLKTFWRKHTTDEKMSNDRSCHAVHKLIISIKLPDLPYDATISLT